MAKNDFKAFAIGSNSNVVSQSEYEELTALASGFQTGTAFSEQLNKVWRQSSVMSSVLADFIAQQSGDDVLDDANLVNLKDSLLKALLKYSLSQFDSRYLKSASNLSDLSNNNVARDNLGVYSKQVTDSKYLQSLSNLSDIANKDVARDNLGVYSKQITDGKYLQLLSNLYDVPNKDVARDNLGVYSKQLTDSKYLQSLSNFYDVPNKDAARDNLSVYSKSLSDNKYLQVDNYLYDIKNKAGARYNLELKSAAICDVGSQPGTVAAGDDVRIVNSLDKRTGGVIAGAISSTFPDTYRIAVNGIGQFWRMDGVALYLLLTNRGDIFGTYNDLRPFTVNVDNGNVTMAHQVNVGTLYTNSSIFVGNAVYQDDGNIKSTLWGGSGIYGWLANNNNVLMNDSQNRANQAREDAKYWSSQNLVSNVQRGAQGSMIMDGQLVEAPQGCVLTGGNGNEGNQVGYALYRPLQIARGGFWATIGG